MAVSTMENDTSVNITLNGNTILETNTATSNKMICVLIAANTFEFIILLFDC